MTRREARAPWRVQLRVVWCLLCCSEVLSCIEVQLISSKYHNRVFSALPFSHTTADGLGSRPSFFSPSTEGEKDLYLYHVVSGRKGEDMADGLGRWVVNDMLGKSDTALLFQNSWAVLPTLTSALADNQPNLHWKVHDGSSWVSDEEIQVTCNNDQKESTIYFNVEGAQWRISGYYTEHNSSFDGFPVYTHIGTDDESQTYLYKKQDKWMIGHDIGSNSGLAYTSAPHVNNAQGLINTKWKFATSSNPVWQQFDVQIITGDAQNNIYANLQRHRSLTRSDNIYGLRNGLNLPAIGLGTGGIARESTEEVLAQALRLGYRLLDSAREYGNERQIGNVLSSYKAEADFPNRSDVFVVSKVWPTFLGFTPTSQEITHSLEALQSSYVDQYLLHWPTCQSSVSWMHCETTVDSSGNWKQSWNALEKAYAEGRVASIGVSNFDKQLLGEFWGFGSVRPHLVQNFADPGKLDMDVREWCARNDAIYMPYAHQRNLKFLAPSLKEKILSIAEKYRVSSHVVVSRFFLQTGAAIVPRSSQLTHLNENFHGVNSLELSENDMASMGWKSDQYSPRNEL